MALLTVENLKMYYPVRGGVFHRTRAVCKAVDGVGFSLEPGETLGLVGESGCGKSTVAKSVVRLLKPTAGRVVFEGNDITRSGAGELRTFRREMQMVFQDPAESLNPRHTVGQILEEPFVIQKIGTRNERGEWAADLLRRVGLPADALGRYPFEFSGGQRQRIGIARALALWHGFTPALGLSALVLAGGFGLWWITRPATREADAPRSASTVAYDRAYETLLSGSRRITGLTQSGSLPLYLGIVLLSLATATGAALAVDRGLLDVSSFPIANSPLEVAICLVTALSSLGVILARQRFGAALALGGSGYLLALVFLLQGAPDLAVTQFLVETVTVAVYVLVLARLPQRFSPAPAWAPLWVRIALSVVVGVSVAGFALHASTARQGPSVAEEYLRRSEPEAGGRNVVNVILVDFRGFDTLGEITVLAIAGAGVVNLVAAARREQRRKHLDDGTDVEDLSGRSPEVWR